MRIIKRSNKYNGYYQLDELELKSDLNGEQVLREQFLVPHSVGVLVHHLSKNKIILVEQFRIGPEKKLLEIVAGKIEGKDMNPESTAKREVIEETGYQAISIELIHEFYTSPGPLNEMMSLYYAIVEDKIEVGGGLATELEEITIHEWEIEKFIKHSFNDAKTIMSQQWLKLKKL